jgi:hypothetical protein
MEVFMAFVTGDVVAVSGEELPFKVVFKQGDTVLAEWLVQSKEEGEEEIVETLKSLMDDEDDKDDRDDDDGDDRDEDDDRDDDDDD